MDVQRHALDEGRGEKRAGDRDRADQQREGGKATVSKARGRRPGRRVQRHAANRPALMTGVNRGRPLAPPLAIVGGTEASDRKAS